MARKAAAHEAPDRTTDQRVCPRGANASKALARSGVAARRSRRLVRYDLGLARVAGLLCTCPRIVEARGRG